MGNYYNRAEDFFEVLPPGSRVDCQLHTEEGLAYIALIRFTSVWDSSFSIFDGETFWGIVDIPVIDGVVIKRKEQFYLAIVRISKSKPVTYES